MGIGDYTNKLTSAGGSGANNLFVATPDTLEKIHVEAPVKAPAFGIKILAWLSNVPGLGSWEALKQARTDVDCYIRTNTTQRVKSRACLSGFVDALKGAYGAEIADMCVKTAGIKPEQRLTARQVTAAINIGTEKSAAYQKINAQTVDRYFQGVGRSVMPDTHAGARIEALARQQCAALPAYSQGQIGEAKVADITRKVVMSYEKICTSEDKAIADDPLRALTFELSKTGGDVDPAFQTAMVNNLAAPVVSDRLITLSGGEKVGQEFYQAVMSGAFSLRVEREGEAPIEIGGGDAWGKLPQDERSAKLEQGYLQLMDFCTRESIDAGHLTKTFPQCVHSSFLNASRRVDNAAQTPLRLLDGRVVTPEGATDEALQVTIRRGDAHSLPSFKVEYSAKGFRSAECDGKTLWLDPESTLAYSYEATLGEDAAYVLTQPVSCESTLVEREVVGGAYPEPIPADLERADNPAYEDMVVYAGQQKDPVMIQDVRQLGLLNAFHKAPSLEALNRFLEQLGDDTSLVPKASRDSFKAAFRAHFDPLVGALETLLKELSGPEDPDEKEEIIAEVPDEKAAIAAKARGRKVAIIAEAPDDEVEIAAKAPDDEVEIAAKAPVKEEEIVAEDPNSAAAIFYFRKLAGALRGTQSLEDALDLYRDAVLGEKEDVKLVLTDEQLNILREAHAKAIAPVEANVIELMGTIRKNLVDRLGANFLPGFVSAMKNGG